MINFSIGGFYKKSKELYFLIELLESQNYKWLKDNYTIKSVYGSFPNAIWNGGRTTVGFPWSFDKISKTIKYYNSKNIGLNFTFTNPFIEPKHLTDYYCNTLLELANNKQNSIILNSMILYEHIKKRQLEYSFISSITKQENKEAFIESMSKFDLLIPPTFLLNNNPDLFNSLDCTKLEILVNEVCFIKDCRFKKEHYDIVALRNMNLDSSIEDGFCESKYSKQIDNKHENHIPPKSIEQLNMKYNISNFKFSGRAQPSGRFFEEFCFFLIKDEYKIDFYNNILYYFDIYDSIIPFETYIKFKGRPQ